MHVRSRQSGFTLLEVVLAGGLAAGITLAAMKMWTIVGGAQKEFTARFEMSTQAVPILQRFKKQARGAQSCAKSGGALVCTTVNPPGTVAQPAVVRYTVDANGTFLYQRDEAGTWKTLESAPNSEFVVCDRDEMAAGTCPILPLELSVQMAKYKASGTVFRFRYTTSRSIDGLPVKIDHQSSFSLRNLTIPNVAYLEH